MGCRAVLAGPWADGLRIVGPGGGPPGHRAAPSGSRVAGAPRRARRAAGSWGLGSLGCPVAGRWAVSVGLTDREVVGLRSLICGVLGCRGGLLGRESIGLLGRWGAGTRRAMGRQIAALAEPRSPGCSPCPHRLLFRRAVSQRIALLSPVRCSRSAGCRVPRLLWLFGRWLGVLRMIRRLSNC